jgi:hypothetical protein
VQDWADALDEKVEAFQRLAPGALLQLYSGEPLEDELQMARRGFQQRLTQTPGVVATKDGRIGASLTISANRTELPAHINGHLNTLRKSWETPDGQPVMEAVDVWRHARELSCGFYYKWVPPAPREWMAARKAWFAFVREALSHSRTLDSPLQVSNACKRGELPADEYWAWQAIKDTFEPNNVPQWVDDTALKICREWLKEPGICWVEHIAFGETLSMLSGIPYFGRGGMDPAGRSIESMEGASVIASIASNSEGRNLQAWNRSLVSSCPPHGGGWEQLLGRLHREGQEADSVEFEVLMLCEEQEQGFQQALSDARYIEDVTGQAQKLLYADLDL